MMKQRLAFALIGLLLPHAAPAETLDNPKAVGQALETCLAADQHSSTYDTVECHEGAYRAYDRLLNTTYNYLMQILDAGSRDLLRDAQREWLRSQRTDNDLWTGPWVQKAGTISRIEAAQSSMEATRSRLLELRALQIAATPG